MDTITQLSINDGRNQEGSFRSEQHKQQTCLVDIHRTLLPATAEHRFLSSAQETMTTIGNILYRNAGLRIIYLLQSMFSG